MRPSFTFLNIRDYQVLFRIGIFLPYNENLKDKGIELRNFLRSKGFHSAFLVENYPNKFKNNREKSFHYVAEAHVSFFIIEADVGKGGVVSELEEYKRIVYPKKGKTACLFEKFESRKGILEPTPSSVIKPNITEEKFYVSPFYKYEDLPELMYGKANTRFIETYKINPEKVLDMPKHRLTCEKCSKRESKYIRYYDCPHTCSTYHVCEECLSNIDCNGDCFLKIPNSV